MSHSVQDLIHEISHLQLPKTAMILNHAKQVEALTSLTFNWLLKLSINSTNLKTTDYLFFFLDNCSYFLLSWQTSSAGCCGDEH